MDRLWSPWRWNYVTVGETQTGCVFCDAPRSSVQESLVVFEGQLAYIILNLYPYTNGHLMVVPYRHVDTLAGLRDDEMREVARLTQHAETALRQAYQPHGLNIGINLGKAAGAGIIDHLHVHVVPRWDGDANFMSVIGETRVLPEELAATAARLRPVFARLLA
jgi:ATP adenylyltransferase